MKPEILWSPEVEFAQDSNLASYIEWLKKYRNLVFDDYQSLWNWSVTEIEQFWLSLFDYFKIEYQGNLNPVLSGNEMPYIRWFEDVKLNYAKHIFRNYDENANAIIFGNELGDYREVTWKELKEKVASFANFLINSGIKKGDAVVAYMPNVPETTIAFLATNSIGAIWSSASPDFGVDSIVDRFAQINPKVFLAVNGYTYNGKKFYKTEVVNEICNKLTTLQHLIIHKYLSEDLETSFDREFIDFEECVSQDKTDLHFVEVEFNHPMWVLYSSGTTGLPKAITHSTGGMLLEHLKYLSFHNNVKKNDRFFWFSTTGWMMWNFVQASLLLGSTIVLFEGSPAFPDLKTLWKFAERARIVHFGTSAPYIIACMKGGLEPGIDYDLSYLQSISSTGAPLPPEGFAYIYNNIKKNIWLASMSGGTDVCTAFVGGNPMIPVPKGEIQCRALGSSVFAFDDEGNSVYDQVGEMVLTRPMPSMPVYFWGDNNFLRYKSSYFLNFQGIWRHGDWVSISGETFGLVIHGRSDATLNRHGVRIGTAEIYRAIDMVSEIQDSLIVNLELPNGDHYMPLFVMMKNDVELTEELIKKIKLTLKSEYSPRHVPDEIIQVSNIPYTISGKKMEEPVKKILLGMNPDKVLNKDSIKNPQSIDFFVKFATFLNSTK